MKSPAARVESRRSVAILLPILVLVVAWSLYRPDVARPFDYVDFPENVLLLRDHDGFGARFTALIKVYAQHGRWSPISLAAIAAQWSLFESWTPGWQWFRFVVMSCAVLLALRLSRRVGLTALGSLAAAALLIVSPAAVTGWLRLSTGEPLGMIFVLLGCHLALRKRSRTTGIAFGLMLLGVMWTKEIMTTSFLFPVLLLLTKGDNQLLQAPAWRTQGEWIAPSLIALVIGAAPVLWAWQSAPAGSFASLYGSRASVLGDVVGASLAAWLPFAPVTTGSVTPLLLVTVAFGLLVISGWQSALKPSAMQTHRKVILAAGLLIPVVGGVVYSPWPFYLVVYALPFSLAGSWLLGQAVTSSLEAGPLRRTAGLIFLAVVLTYGWAQAANEASRTRALHSAFVESVNRVAAMQDVESVFVEVAPSQFDARGNFGPRFKTYAQLLGLEWPDVRDVRCGDPLPSSHGVLVLRLNLMCDPDSEDVPAIVTVHRRFDWPNPLPRADSVTVTLLWNAP